MSPTAAKRRSRTGSATTKTRPRSFDNSGFIRELFAAGADPNAIDTALQRMLDCLKKIVPYEAATVYRSVRETGRLEPVLDIDHRVGMVDFVRIGSGDGLTGWSARSTRPILLADRSRSVAFDPKHDDGSFIAYPLALEQRLIAVVNLGAAQSGTFTSAHVKRLEQLAVPFAFALENVFLRKDLGELSSTRRQIEETLQKSRESVTMAQSLTSIIDLATETNHIINEALSVIVGNVQCLLVENAVNNQKSASRLRRIEQAALNINECNRKLLRIASIVEQAARTSITG